MQQFIFTHKLSNNDIFWLKIKEKSQVCFKNAQHLSDFNINHCRRQNKLL